jgi:hypothetical protein
MELMPREKFLRWAASVGIGFDPRYPDARCLSFLPSKDHARFWVVPPDPATWSHFIASLLDCLDEWATGLLWPRSGAWPESRQSRSQNERVRDVFLRGAGISEGWTGAVRFERDEQAALIAVLFAYLAFGWCADDDLFFIPEHGRQLIQTDHHDVIHVQCVSEDRVQNFALAMAKAGHELPSEVPDWTFKRPAWMGSA